MTEGSGRVRTRAALAGESRLVVHPAGAAAAAPGSGASLSPSARLLLWDYVRGSLPYDVLCLLLLLLLLLVPPDWWRDPMVSWP
jgi:hypothetical protein